MFQVLPHLQTSSSVRVMRDIISANELPRITAHEWLMSIALFRR